MRWRSYSLLILLLLALCAGGLSQTNETYDIGFRPDINGFGFENWGSSIHTAGVTAVEMQRMFGDRVYSYSNAAAGKTILSPPAKAWMDEANKAMLFGHCEGMAVLATLLYYHRVSPGGFGSNETDSLLLSNEPLQREIAYWWVTQATIPGGSRKVKDSPNEVLDTLISAFRDGRNATEWWTLGLYRPDGSGGHAITPFRVEDNPSNGTARIMVYDNNFPKLTRAVTVDRRNNSWSYTASINPNRPSALYTGNASTKTLEVVSIPPRLVQQRCDFCEENTSLSLNRTKGTVASEGHVQFWVDGNASILVSDESGRRTGFVGPGQFVYEIPNSSAQSLKYLTEPWTVDQQPVITVPQSPNISARLKASAPVDPDLTAIGPNYVVRVENLALNPGEEVVLAVTPSGNTISAVLSTPKQGPGSLGSAKTATLVLGVNTPTESYTFTVQDVVLEVGGTLGLQFDPASGAFTFESNGVVQLTYTKTIGVTSSAQLTFNVEQTDRATGETTTYSYEGGGTTGAEGQLPVGSTNTGTIPTPWEPGYNNGTSPTMHVVAHYF